MYFEMSSLACKRARHGSGLKSVAMSWSVDVCYLDLSMLLLTWFPERLRASFESIQYARPLHEFPLVV